MNVKTKAQRVYPELKVKELLDAMGSDKEIAEVLRSYGYEPPPLPSIRGWRSRNSVPMCWVPVLLDWAIAKGQLKRPLHLARALV